MSKQKFTPGPWSWTNQYKSSNNDATWSLIGADGYGILSCDGVGNSPQNCRPDDAQLIAAAPDLLDALKYALPYLEACIPNPRNGINHDYSVDVNVVDRARAAIAKALGE